MAKQSGDQKSGLGKAEERQKPAATMSVAEVARFLGVTTDWVYRHARAGHLPGNRSGAKGHWRFDAEQVQRYLRGEWSPPKEAA
jgi:excisionase family DNA binding protein